MQTASPEMVIDIQLTTPAGPFSRPFDLIMKNAGLIHLDIEFSKSVFAFSCVLILAWHFSPALTFSYRIIKSAIIRLYGNERIVFREADINTTLGKDEFSLSKMFSLSQMKWVLSIIFCAILGDACFQLTRFAVDDCKNILLNALYVFLCKILRKN